MHAMSGKSGVKCFYSLSYPSATHCLYQPRPTSNNNLFCWPASTLKLCGRSGYTMYALLLSATFMQYRRLGLVLGSLPEPLQSCVSFAGLCWTLGNAIRCFFSCRWCAVDWDIEIRLPAEIVCFFSALIVKYSFDMFWVFLEDELTETPPDLAKCHSKPWAFDLPAAKVITGWVITGGFKRDHSEPHIFRFFKDIFKTSVRVVSWQHNHRRAHVLNPGMGPICGAQSW